MSDANPEVMRVLGSIEGKLDAVIKTNERQEATLTEQAKRINTTERTISRHRGVGIGAGAVMSLALAVLGFERFGG